MTGQQAEAAIGTLMHRYIDLFNIADFERALTECYHLPFSWLVGQSVDTVLTPAHFVARMAGMRSGLADNGLERSELLDCTVRMMGPDAALAGVKVARHYTDGREPEISAATYVAHHDGQGWRLTSLIAHPVDALVR